MVNEYVKGKPFFTSKSTYNQYNYLSEDIETEVLIIGGGATGAICGYYFSKDNIPSVIIEKDRIGHCSTSVTTALLQYELDSSFAQLIPILGKENIATAYKLDKFALSEINKIINEYGNECEYYERDTLFYSNDMLDKKIIEEEFSLRKEYGFDVELITSKSSPYTFPLKYGVLAKNGGAEIDPYKFTRQLLNISSNNGVKIYENTEARKINYFDDYIEVETSYGYKIKCKKIIVATGYNTDLFTSKHFATKYTTFNLVTKPLNEEPWNNKVLIRNTSDPYNYLRSTPDNRIIIGGADINFSDINNEKLCNKQYSLLEDKLRSMFPNKKNIEVEYKYCGCFASTQDNLGFIGPSKKTNKNLWYCLGYGANGILFSMLGAFMLSKLYKNNYDPNMSLFDPDRFDN